MSFICCLKAAPDGHQAGHRQKSILFFFRNSTGSTSSSSPTTCTLGWAPAAVLAPLDVPCLGLQERGGEGSLLGRDAGLVDNEWYLVTADSGE